MKYLAISGSLRLASNNSALLRAVAAIAAPQINIELYTELGDLPLFNPDIEDAAPPVITRLRQQLNAADAVLIASPEYAHGVTGAMKNALDWMVGCEAFVNKPVVLFNTSPRATHAQAALRETLKVMSAIIIDEASISLPILGSKLDETGIIAHPQISGLIRDALRVLQAALQQIKTDMT